MLRAAHVTWAMYKVRVKLGGLDMKIGKISKFLKIDLYIGSPMYAS